MTLKTKLKTPSIIYNVIKYQQQAVNSKFQRSRDYLLVTSKKAVNVNCFDDDAIVCASDHNLELTGPNQHLPISKKCLNIVKKHRFCNGQGANPNGGKGQAVSDKWKDDKRLTLVT